MKRWRRRKTAVKLTDKAAGKIKDLLGANGNADEQALRVAVRGGGCSGFQYALALDQAKDEDHVFEHQGVAVVVDKVSMQFVFGSEVDYVDGLQGAGFVVNNPNVVAACGCGSSFQVREDAAEGASRDRLSALRPLRAARLDSVLELKRRALLGLGGRLRRRGSRRPRAARRRAARPARRTRTSPRRCRSRRPARR